VPIAALLRIPAMITMVAAGLLVGPATTVEPYMMRDPMMKGFAGWR